jgi:acyl-CoA synthetase (AMP-forming)/AMP-acid ligase II
VTRGKEPPSTLPALLADVVARRGAHPAIVTAGETLNYAQLEARSAEMARALLAAGAGKGARIALLAPDGVFWLTAFLASLRIGALLTAVSTLATPPELAHILRHSDCQFLLAQRRFLKRDYAEGLEAALCPPAESEAGALQLPDAPYLRAIWLDDSDGLRWVRPLSELLARAGEVPEALLAAVEREVAPSDPAVVIYTSGSTAQPKAVVHAHWAVARHPAVLAENFALTPDDRMMCLLPLFWLAGLSMALQVLSIGATLVYPDTPEIDNALAMIEKRGITRVNAWGGKQPQLVAAAKAKGVDFSAIPDLAGFGDAQGPLGDKISMYGMTESFSAHSAEKLGMRLPEEKAASYGRAIGGYERRVVDPATGRELPPGEVGELQIRGPAMLAGFYKADRRAVFTVDGFYPTGDLVKIDAEGWLFPAGRIADVIKTKGANVSRLEVEAALTALPTVAQAFVAGLPDPDAGTLVVAAVLPAAGAAPSEQDLREALRGRLSSFKIPRRIVFVAEDDIPRTATGKVKLPALTELIAGRLEQST